MQGCAAHIWKFAYINCYMAYTENVGTDGREHYTETKIVFKSTPSTDDEEELQEEKIQKLKEMFSTNSSRRAAGRQQAEVAGK